MTRAFTFPGQGSQSVGMGADLAEAFAAAREVFQGLVKIKPNDQEILRKFENSAAFNDCAILCRT